MSSTAIQKGAVGSVTKWLEDNQQKFTAILPAHMYPYRCIRTAIQAPASYE